jgi:hypothetical protein
MAIESVRVAFLKDEVVPSFVDGVTVRVFDSDGLLITSAVSGESGVDGTVELELDGSLSSTVYQLRFFLPGASIPPKRIAVFSPASAAPTATNDFVVTAEVFALEPAVDPSMCRCSGHLIGPAGRPRPGVDVTFLPKFYAFVDDARAALTGRFTVRTNKLGFLSVDLYRRGMYEVTIEGRELLVRNIEVPDRSSILLSHLLLPVVVSVTYAETGPYAVVAGQTLTLTPMVRATDYRELGVGAEDVAYSIADPTIASVQILGDRIAIRGLNAGTTVLRVTRLDNSIVYLPDLGIAGGDVPIVVTGA